MVVGQRVDTTTRVALLRILISNYFFCFAARPLLSPSCTHTAPPKDTRFPSNQSPWSTKNLLLTVACSFVCCPKSITRRCAKRASSWYRWARSWALRYRNCPTNCRRRPTVHRAAAAWMRLCRPICTASSLTSTCRKAFSCVPTRAANSPSRREFPT